MVLCLVWDSGIMFGGTCQVSVGKCHMLSLYNLTLSTYCSLAYPGKRKKLPMIYVCYETIIL